MPTPRPTVRDVAAAAGVSFKTVSRVVNGEPHVAEATAARVLEAIAELGYAVDDRARRLRRGEVHTGVIGFVLVDVANPFFSGVLRGIQDTARAADLLVLSGSTDGDLEREQALVDAFVGRRVDGLVVVTSDPDATALDVELGRGTPVVFVDIEPDRDDVDVVRSDHRAGGVLATEHLLAHGHRDIAFVGDADDVYSADEREAGFRAAMAAAGLDVPSHRVVRAGRTVEEWERFGREAFRDEVPDAVFSAQNFVTRGLVRALHRLDLQHRVALVGHDDVVLADVVSPGITVVPQDPRELGRRAARRLLDRLEGDTGPPRRDLLAPTLLPRGSGELPRPPSAARAG